MALTKKKNKKKARAGARLRAPAKKAVRKTTAVLSVLRLAKKTKVIKVKMKIRISKSVTKTVEALTVASKRKRKPVVRRIRKSKKLVLLRLERRTRPAPTNFSENLLGLVSPLHAKRTEQPERILRSKTQANKPKPSPFIFSRAMRSFATRTVAVILMVALNIGGLRAVGTTAAYFNDSETSTGNTYKAGSVDFTLSQTPYSLPQTAVSFMSGATASTTIKVIPEASSNPFWYHASSTNFGVDLDFCQTLSLQSFLEGAQNYSGPLSNFISPATTTLDDWRFDISTNVNSYNKICTFDFDYNAWQERHNLPSFNEMGFSDKEITHNKIASKGFRINKVYYDVAPDRGEENDNEWVEVYNQTDSALDLSGWKICDNTSCDTIPASTPLVPSLGYAWITNNPNTASSTAPAPWYLPSGVVYIPLNSAIGNGLGNDADMLILKRSDDVIVDQMNWGTPDSGWTNYNADVWNPGAMDAAEGNVLARVPSGYDTDQASDWKELKPPSVDLIYPDEGGSYTWYWGYSYNIRWIATNHNGPDSALKISLYYIMDVNHDNVISVGDTTNTIVASTTNDGSYIWTVPPNFIGYIWIKLVATGPENPFLNTATVSGSIWDPIPLFIGPYGIDPKDLDMEAPVITPNGNNPALVPMGSEYSDLGAIVTDNVDDNLGYQTEGEVDTGTLGQYNITYEATDQMGNVGTAARLVIVYDPALGEPDLSNGNQSGSALTDSSGLPSEAPPAPEETSSTEESDVTVATSTASTGDVSTTMASMGESVILSVSTTTANTEDSNSLVSTSTESILPVLENQENGAVDNEAASSTEGTIAVSVPTDENNQSTATSTPSVEQTATDILSDASDTPDNDEQAGTSLIEENTTTDIPESAPGNMVEASEPATLQDDNKIEPSKEPETVIPISTDIAGTEEKNIEDVVAAIIPEVAPTI